MRIATHQLFADECNTAINYNSNGCPARVGGGGVEIPIAEDQHGCRSPPVAVPT
jgi:hypothetical protein